MRLSFYKNIFNSFLDSIQKYRNEFLLINIQSINLYNILFILKNNSIFLFKVLSDICVIDNPSHEKRFGLVYQLLSIKYKSRIFIKTSTCSYIQSSVDLFNSAD